MKFAWIATFFLVLIWSAIDPKDDLTWFMEIAPALIALLILAATYRTFPLTPLLYGLILMHCMILMVGAHYTYADVPFFETFKSTFGWTRNNYDKLGHFMQGFDPAIIAREILIRQKVVASVAWRNFFILSICLAISALYELIEWTAAMLIGSSADAFLATQGDSWDTQSDMAFALVGAIVALSLLGKIHDAQLNRLALTETNIIDR